MRISTVGCLLLALAVPALGDTVYLVNGNKFEDVVAESAAGEVRISLQQGEIVLPARLVARVERSPSAWREFERRAKSLEAARAPASAWLELARWADGAGYSPGVRRALLRAAALEPALDGLAPLMARIGYLRERDSGGWVSEEVYMRRRGYREWGDHWLPREEVESRLRAQQEAETRRREDARQERIARAIEALVVARLSEAAERRPEPEPVQARGPLVAVYSGAYFGFAATPSAVAPREDQPERTTYEDLVGRSPGSLFPVRPRHTTRSAE